VWLDDAEIAALARAGGGLVHCAGSNLFLGDGIAPIPKYLRAGVTIALGCDSGSANNRLSIFGELRLAATLQKGVAQDAAALTARQVFMMGTAHGAHATGQPVGDLVAGRYADLVALDLADLSLQPPHDLLRNVVYAMEPAAVRRVYVHGAQVVRNGRLVKVAERTIVERVRALTAGWTGAGSL
jgi:5-methylthioadenosine/S-adenosylhomocysteine deaminase